MLDHIAKLDDIEKEALQIQEFLEESISDDPESCVQRGNKLVVYLARTSKLLADSKYHKDKALANSIVRNLGEQAGAPPSVLNKLVDAACMNENMVMNLVDKLNRTCTHQIDWLRTVVSKAKEERRTVGGVSNQPESHGDYRIPQDQEKDYSPF